MFGTMKYITFEGPMFQEIIIFVNTWDHSIFADRMGIKQEDIIGAGFIQCNRDNPEPSCYGKSVSLKVSAHENDTKILRHHLKY
jgi:hypothetical protein